MASRKPDAPTAAAALDRADAIRASYVVGCHVDEITALDGVVDGNLDGAVVTVTRRFRRDGQPVEIVTRRRIAHGGWVHVDDDAAAAETAPAADPDPAE